VPFQSLLYPLLSYRFHLFGAAILVALVAAAKSRERVGFHLRWAAAFVAGALIQSVLLSSVGVFGALWWLLAFVPVVLALVYLGQSRAGQSRAAPGSAGPRTAGAAAAAPQTAASGAGGPQPVAVKSGAPQPVPSSQPAAPRLLKIRSVAEEHLYMDLHPCACGEADWRQLKGVQRYADNELVKAFEGPCPRCGTPREFLFIVPETPFFAPLGYGGPEPSSILDAGQFLAESDRLVRLVPASLAGLDEAARKQAQSRMAWGVAALEEVLKFIPAGADAVPESALISPESVRFSREMPGQFRGLRLEARLQAYRDILRKFEAPAGG
jgi:hypothetical protein